MLTKLFPWQLRALDEIERHKSLYFNCEVGTGKTLATVECIKKIMRTEGAKKAIIITLPGVIPGWLEEFEKSGFDLTKIKALTGSWQKRAELVNQGEILMTNHESLANEFILKQLIRFKADILVIDEAHKEKSPKSKRTKGAIKLADTIERKFLLSGTRVLNNLMDVWSQYRILDGGHRLGEKFNHFRNRFFFDLNAGWSARKGYFPQWVPRAESYQAIGELVDDITITIKQDEFLKLPPLMSKKYYVDLTPQQRRMYDELDRDLVTFINENTISGGIGIEPEVSPIIASQAMVKVMRLQQIASGFIKDESNNTIALGTPQKIHALEEIFNERAKHHKIIVWAVFKHDYDQIRQLCKKLDLGYVEYHGEIKQELRDIGVKAFQQNNQTRIFIANPQAAGAGLNLQVSDMSVYYSRNYHLEHYLQSIGRNRRSGSEIHERIIHFDLIAKNTRDEHILECLQEKKNYETQLTNWKRKNVA